MTLGFAGQTLLMIAGIVWAIVNGAMFYIDYFWTMYDKNQALFATGVATLCRTTLCLVRNDSNLHEKRESKRARQLRAGWRNNGAGSVNRAIWTGLRNVAPGKSCARS